MPKYSRNGITLNFDKDPSDDELDEAFKTEEAQTKKEAPKPHGSHPALEGFKENFLPTALAPLAKDYATNSDILDKIVPGKYAAEKVAPAILNDASSRSQKYFQRMYEDPSVLGKIGHGIQGTLASVPMLGALTDIPDEIINPETPDARWHGAGALMGQLANLALPKVPAAAKATGKMGIAAARSPLGQAAAMAAGDYAISRSLGQAGGVGALRYFGGRMLRDAMRGGKGATEETIANPKTSAPTLTPLRKGPPPKMGTDYSENIDLPHEGDLSTLIDNIMAESNKPGPTTATPEGELIQPKFAPRAVPGTFRGATPKTESGFNFPADEPLGNFIGNTDEALKQAGLQGLGNIVEPKVPYKAPESVPVAETPAFRANKGFQFEETPLDLQEQRFPDFWENRGPGPFRTDSTLEQAYKNTSDKSLPFDIPLKEELKSSSMRAPKASMKNRFDPTVEGGGTSALSSEELARARSGEQYYKVSRSGNLTYMGPKPDAMLTNGEGIVRVQPNKIPVVTNFHGATPTEVLDRFLKTEVGKQHNPKSIPSTLSGQMTPFARALEGVKNAGGSVVSVKDNLFKWRDSEGNVRVVDLNGRVGPRNFGISARQQGVGERQTGLNPRNPLKGNLGGE